MHFARRTHGKEKLFDKRPMGIYTITEDRRFMIEAIKEAEKAAEKEEVPVGAVAVFEKRIIAKRHNEVEAKRDPTAHAEMLVLKDAQKALGRKWLNGVTLYSTLKPCRMCEGAMELLRIERCVFGAEEKKRIFGKVEIENGVLREECGRMLSRFFKALRYDNRDKRRGD
jgi:tRNA(adenine34) deaminase